MNMARRTNVLMAIVLVAFSVWGYVRLPDTIPTHFGLDGKPDGYGSRVTFLVMPAIAVITAIGVAWSGKLIRRKPSLVNLPDKKRFLALPEREQQWVLDEVVEMMEYIATGTLALFLAIELIMYRSALGHATGGTATGILIALMLGTLVLPIVMLVRIQGRVNEAVRRTKVGGGIR